MFTRIARGASPWTMEFLFLAIASVGVFMNVVVILANGGMPVAMSLDQIPEEQRSSYLPIDARTRFRILADWIDVGWAYYSPGDVVVDLGAFGLIGWFIISAFLR